MAGCALGTKLELFPPPVPHRARLPAPHRHQRSHPGPLRAVLVPRSHRRQLDCDFRHKQPTIRVLHPPTGNSARSRSSAGHIHALCCDCNHFPRSRAAWVACELKFTKATQLSAAPVFIDIVGAQRPGDRPARHPVRCRVRALSLLGVRRGCLPDSGKFVFIRNFKSYYVRFCFFRPFYAAPCRNKVL